MTAQFVRHESNTSPGGKVTISVWVWTTVRSQHVIARAIASAHGLLKPQFTECPSTNGAACSVGSLPANHAFEMMITDHVKPGAHIGTPFAIAVNVTARSFTPAQAAAVGVVGQGIKQPTSPFPLPPTTLVPLPGATITPAGLSGLFPTVTPQPSPSSGSAHTRRPTRVTEVSSALPLSSRLIGGQLAGLAVLAAAITMVVARLSLRTAQAPAGSGIGDAGTSSSGTGDQSSGGSGTSDPGTDGTGEPTADAYGPDGETSDDKAAD